MENWTNNFLQFPRLLDEIRAVGLNNEQLRLIGDSMDLTRPQIDELFERTSQQWELIKQDHAPMKFDTEAAQKLRESGDLLIDPDPLGRQAVFTTEEIDRMMRIAQDVKKVISYDKTTGTWYWYDNDVADNPDDHHTGFESFIAAMNDALEPYTAPSE